jgi:ribonuclease R
VSLQKEIMAALAASPQGLSQAELVRALKLPKRVQAKVFQDLEALVSAGKVVKNARHRFRAAAFAKEGGAGALAQAVFSLTKSGLAFARTAEGVEYFIPERFRGWALPGDSVELKPLPERPEGGARRGGAFGGRKEERGGPARKPGAEVRRVLARGRSQWVGRLRKDGKECFCDVRLGELDLELELAPEGIDPAAQPGDWVVAGAPGLDVDGREPAPSRFISRLGGDDTPHLDTLIIIKKAALKEDFDAATLKEAAGFATGIPGEAVAGRLDLRQGVVITIDGQDAKDFDDAVSLERLPGKSGWRLGVHIADVAHYVRPGSALDNEAYERATSVYLPDRVLPMLPEALSNGLCSLKPKVDRLTLSAVMDLDERGRVVGARFAESVIRSARRCTYEEIEAWYEGKGGLDAAEAALLGPTLKDMRAVAQLRRTLRMERGALDFDFPETKVSLDDKGVPTALTRRARLFTHQLIEEFMLAANEAVAKELREAGYALLFRIHEEPDEDKLNDTLAFLGKLKLGGPKGGSTTPKDLQRLLARVEGRPEQRLVQTLVLRSLRLARYSPGHDIHFGLALEDYCHFTSPIRRYPDLVVHRMLKARLKGQLPAAARAQAGDLEAVGVHSSTMERRAEACERDCVKAKQVRYLEARLGQAYAATVSSVVHFGFFCEIDAFPAEGLVPLGSLRDDYYDFDAANYCLVGSRKKKKISIGDKLWVKVLRCDWELLQVDFEPLWEEPKILGLV